MKGLLAQCGDAEDRPHGWQVEHSVYDRLDVVPPQNHLTPQSNHLLMMWLLLL